MSKDNNDDAAIDVRMFDKPALFVLLESVDGGSGLKAAEELLRELITESYERGGKSELTIKVKFEATLKEGRAKAEVRVEVSAKGPKQPAGVSTFFATEDGALRDDDPAQPELEPDMGKTVRPARRKKAAAEKEAS